jgi:hypothetical protein
VLNEKTGNWNNCMTLSDKGIGSSKEADGNDEKISGRLVSMRFNQCSGHIIPTKTVCESNENK